MCSISKTFCVGFYQKCDVIPALVVVVVVWIFRSLQLLKTLEYLVLYLGQYWSGGDRFQKFVYVAFGFVLKVETATVLQHLSSQSMEHVL